MKINYVQISNILSFPYHKNIDDAPKLDLNNGLNVLIGENGSGKSTFLEVLNFILKEVLMPYCVNDFARFKEGEKNKEAIKFQKRVRFEHYRLEKNRNTTEKERKIQLEIELEENDKKNIETINKNWIFLKNMSENHSNVSLNDQSSLKYNTKAKTKFRFVVCLDEKVDVKMFSDDNSNLALPENSYLYYYNLYKSIFELPIQNPAEERLLDPFTLIVCYREYHTLRSELQLSESNAESQDNQLSHLENQQKTNAPTKEPLIFRRLGLHIAKITQNRFQDISISEAVLEANENELLTKINNALNILNLKLRFELVNLNKWEFSLKIFSTLNSHTEIGIETLSSGEKSLLHLILEVYGRNELEGGTLIIDEPELHLHPQFQLRYLEILQEFSEKNQVILATHSEVFINSKTINNIKRFYLDRSKNTKVVSLNFREINKTLVTILDFSRSTHLFFCKKVVLVEGISDQLFFSSVLNKMKPKLTQDIQFLDIGGKKSFANWKQFFDHFKLTVYCIGDKDCENEPPFNDNKEERMFVLGKGAIEAYINPSIGKNKPRNKMENAITFCNDNLDSWLKERNDGVKEIKEIIEQITKPMETEALEGPIGLAKKS